MPPARPRAVVKPQMREPQTVAHSDNKASTWDHRAKKCNKNNELLQKPLSNNTACQDYFIASSWS